MLINKHQGNDYLVQPGDYNRLVAELPNVVKLHIVNYTDWNHIDFLMAVDAPRYQLLLWTVYIVILLGCSTNIYLKK